MGSATLAGLALTCLVSVLCVRPCDSISDADRLTIATRQLMLQQLFVEEKIRADGDSGVKQVRLTSQGTRPYHSDAHSSGRRALSIHDHSNNERTVGLGEFIGVLNGVEFRTRHNDYGLRQPCRDCMDYHKTDNIEYPGVPPSVAALTNISEAITEMREWFKAWRDQDYSVRDYRDYFKPMLCYLEGAWHTAGNFEESFQSDRHFLDASNWFDLHERVRFTSYTGAKDLLENFAFLPTTIMEMVNGTVPRLAQWNYRILCHPLQNDLPLNRFRLEDDVSQRMAAKWTMDQLGVSRAARFQLNPRDEDDWKEVILDYGLLDELMAEIPGKNNYPSQMYDDAFDDTAYHVLDSSVKVNAGYYHRWFQSSKKDAMGVTVQHRGFNDASLFMAITNHSEIAPIRYDGCLDDPSQDCMEEQRWSYAIPLEIIYLTPLSAWNPYNIKYKGWSGSTEGLTVTADGRNGGSPETALNGSNSIYYYITPLDFFTDENVFADAADTTMFHVNILDQDGNVRLTKATGVRIIFGDIPGVGVLRQRYPIFPIHGEGSSVWKELAALEDLAMRPKSNGFHLKEHPSDAAEGGASDNEIAYLLKMYNSEPEYGSHAHTLNITVKQMLLTVNGGEVSGIQTSTEAGHSHTLTVGYEARDVELDIVGKFNYRICDDQDRGDKCADGHRTSMLSLTT